VTESARSARATARTHALPFAGADLTGAYDQPKPRDPGLLAARAWRESREARIAAAKAARPVPTRALHGSRYQGGSSLPARSGR